MPLPDDLVTDDRGSCRYVEGTDLAEHRHGQQNVASPRDERPQAAAFGMCRRPPRSGYSAPGRGATTPGWLGDPAMAVSWSRVRYETFTPARRASATISASGPAAPARTAISSVLRPPPLRSARTGFRPKRTSLNDAASVEGRWACPRPTIQASGAHRAARRNVASH